MTCWTAVGSLGDRRGEYVLDMATGHSDRLIRTRLQELNAIRRGYEAILDAEAPLKDLVDLLIDEEFMEDSGDVAGLEAFVMTASLDERGEVQMETSVATVWFDQADQTWKIAG